MMRSSSRTRSERGAIAIIVGALAIVLFGVAALGVDIASQVNRKHLLKNQLDAAATAAAYYLDTDATGIKDAATNAITYFAKNGKGTLDPTKIDFWCVVARKLNTDNTPATPAQVAAYQIPTATQTAGVCNPDAVSTTTDWKMSDYQNRVRYDGQVFKMTCNATMCAVPCALQARPSNNWSPGLSIANNRAITCNTIRVGAQQNVPFNFAPVLGVDQGTTGSQIAVACKGACGAVAQNPMNVVVVTDRTTSMSTTDEHSMIQGIKDMLLKMSPTQQYVALGTIGRSNTTSRTTFNTDCSTVKKAGTSTASRGTNNWSYSGDTDSANASKLWVPLQFFNNYQSSTGAISTSSNIVKALNCLDPNVTSGGAFSNGTYLAAPLKAAARYVLGDKAGMDSSGFNVGALGGASRSGRIRNVIIFETDGQPFELYTKSTTDPSQNYCGVSTSLTSTVTGCGNGYDLFSDFERATVGSPSTTSTCPSGTKPYTGATACATSYTGPTTCATSTDTIVGSTCWGLTTSTPTCSSGTYYNTNVSTSACLNRVAATATTKNGKTTYSCSTGWTLDGQQCYKAVASPTPACPSGSTFAAKDGSTYGCWANHGAATTPTYTIGYKDTSTTSTYTGGQNACKNFTDVASAFKANNPDNLIITVGYNLNNSTLCGDNNYVWNDNDKVKDVAGGTTYLSKVTTPGGTQITDGSCVSGNGTASSPYVLLTTCKQNVVLNYTTTVIVQGSGNSAVPDVLAQAAGGQGIDASTNSSDCSSPSGRTTENSDGDFFFCAASGDDMGSIFVTALSQVSSGVKLINIPH